MIVMDIGLAYIAHFVGAYVITILVNRTEIGTVRPGGLLDLVIKSGLTGARHEFA